MRKAYREGEIVERVAAKYKHEGYDVVIEPSRRDLPETLRQYQLDLLAKRGNETIVVEIKSRRELAHEKSIAEMAERIQRLKGWRLEMHFVEESPADRHRQVPPLSLDEAMARLESATLIISRKDYASALMLAWSAFEAALRHLSWQADVKMAPWNGQRAVKQLLVVGVLSRSDYQLYMRGLEARNRVVHGGSASQLDGRLARSVISTTRRLLRESANTSSA